jgi:hypothetical protein
MGNGIVEGPGEGYVDGINADGAQVTVRSICSFNKGMGEVVMVYMGNGI